MYRFLLPVVFALFALVLSCGKKSAVLDSISVSILPQKYFVERITGGRYKVYVMVPPGQSPELYEPRLTQINGIDVSFIYFKIGYIPFELSQMSRLSSINPLMKIADTSQGVELISSEHGREHGHGGIDPHIWLSPKAAKTIAANILKALSEAAPEHAAVFAENYTALEADISSADKKISESLRESAGKSFICFHPAWTYFARDYGLKQISIEFEGKEQSPSGMKKIIDAAKKENIKAVFIQKEFSGDIAKAIAKDIGGRVVQLDPLGENWLETIYTISETFKKELETGK